MGGSGREDHTPEQGQYVHISSLKEAACLVQMPALQL